MRTIGLRQHTCKHNNHGVEDYLENADYACHRTTIGFRSPIRRWT